MAKFAVNHIGRTNLVQVLHKSFEVVDVQKYSTDKLRTGKRNITKQLIKKSVWFLFCTNPLWERWNKALPEHALSSGPSIARSRSSSGRARRRGWVQRGVFGLNPCHSHNPRFPTFHGTLILNMRLKYRITNPGPRTDGIDVQDSGRTLMKGGPVHPPPNAASTGGPAKKNPIIKIV